MVATRAKAGAASYALPPSPTKRGRTQRPSEADLDVAATPAPGVLPPRHSQGDAAAARRLYAPPQTDALPLFAAALALGCWAVAMRHALFSVRLPAVAVAPSKNGPLPSSSISPWWDILLTFAAVEFSSTALFITAHDAMHGAVCRSKRWLNDLVGRACLSLYAWFDYGLLYEKHWEHHNHTGRVGGDPDFHGGDPNFFKWFLRFMLTYSTLGQYLRIFAWVFFLQALGAPYENVVLYVAAAPITAAVRLFYFGTYLPHLPPPLAEGEKEKEKNKGGEQRAAGALQTLLRPFSALPPLLPRPRDGSTVMAWQLSHTADVPPIVAFLQCLCFGYHWEHHRFPYAPWFDLPKVRALARRHDLKARCVQAYMEKEAAREVQEQQQVGRGVKGSGGRRTVVARA